MLNRLVVVLLMFHSLSAQDIQVLHSFQYNAGGTGPEGSLVETSPGVFLGTTTGGGNGGTVFQIPSDGAFQTLLTFNPNTQGYGSIGQLYPASNGLLYGVNDSGNGSYAGSVFAVSNAGHVRILQSDSVNASPLIEAADGNLYGVEEDALTGDFNVFRMTLAGDVVNIYDLGQNAQVLGSLMQADDGNLYGMTSGFNDVPGILFRLSTQGSNFETLRTFKNGQGGAGPLIQASNGLLYGVAVFSSPYSPCPGVGSLIFSISLEGNYLPLRPFTGCPGPGVNGAVTGLIQASNGKLYGTTAAGGGYSQGTIFSLNLDGSSFDSIVNIGYTLGADPGGVGGPALVQGSDGWLYGTAYGGGEYQWGTLFRFQDHLTPPLPTVSLLEPKTGTVGTPVRIAGQHLIGATGVEFNGVAAAFAGRGTNYVIAVVPSGATTGPVTVTTANGPSSGKTIFTVE